MPSKPSHPCPHSGGCSELVQSGYCAKHSSDAYIHDRYRGSSASRGYDWTWYKYTRWFIIHNPICHDCDLPTTDVHHIIKLVDGGAKYDATNCMPLCHSHHSTRTAKGE